MEEAVRKGLLCDLDFQFASDPARRRVLLHPEIQAALELSVDIPRMGKLRADFEHFMAGGHITVGMEPFMHGDAWMGRLDPRREGTFDIRSRKRSPGIRVFGRFACLDTFVALELRPRSVRIDGLDKEPLGDRKTCHEWDFAMIETAERWEAIFQDMSPVTGDNVYDYISENWSC